MAMSDTRCWGVIPAAGVGARMASELPKQYLQVAGKPLLRHALDRLLAEPAIAGVMLAVQPGDRRAQSWSRLERTWLTSGGELRADSVLAALRALGERAGERDWVLVHDAARPCLAAADLRRLMAAVRSEGVGGLLAEPVVDTLKRVDEQGRVLGTVAREGLWRAQTPQMFPLGQLRTALEAAIAAAVPVTDEASAMEWAGHPVQVVAGSPRNIKVTVPADLELAALYLGETDTG